MATKGKGSQGDKEAEGEDGDEVACSPVGCGAIADVDGGVAWGKVEGEEAVWAIEVLGDGDAVAVDLPGGVVAEVEHEIAAGGIEGEVQGGFAGRADDRWTAGECGVAGMEGVVIGGDGGVLVGRIGTCAGVEERELRLRGVWEVAGLAEGGVGDGGEGGGEEESEGDWRLPKRKGAEDEGKGKGKDGGEDGEETPGKLEEGELRSVAPDGGGDGCEEQGDGGGEDCQSSKELGWYCWIGILDGVQRRNTGVSPLRLRLRSR